MPLSKIQEVRLVVADIDPQFPILDDATYQYFLDKNSDSIRRSALDAARTILLMLSLRSSDETVDIFSIKGSKAAEQYRLSLNLFLKDPNFNVALNSAAMYAGGISNSDIEANKTSDNNYLKNPVEVNSIYENTNPYNPFEI